ncbi:hypothetical protein HOY82DRAFT_601771 [Tuber indicum]|nr:hypothetical protein HOY82DRAFT_601771 [Tuber indicum]
MTTGYGQVLQMMARFSGLRLRPVDNGRALPSLPTMPGTVGHIYSMYIAKANTAAFRITKTNYNILQGVANPERRLDPKKGTLLSQWIRRNAE